jgi:hypothetical protein
MICGPEQRSRHSDSPRAGRSEDRVPVGGGGSASVHTGAGDHTAFSTTVSLPGVKAAEAWR